jgi:SNF2 family DNA or RNA helicase
VTHDFEEIVRVTPSGLRMVTRVAAPLAGDATIDVEPLTLRIDHGRLRLLRGFDELLCLEGLRGVEHLPHQIETVRRVLRYFRGRVLLADEVGLGKTIEACLLLREYLLRGLVKRVLILVPAPLVSQWREELDSKFGLEFSAPGPTELRKGEEYWLGTDRVLTSLSTAKSRRNFDAVTTVSWDLVIVDEAHHCKNRAALNWKLVDALKRRHLFLLTATPVQNNLVELYNLLTLLEPGHLKTEADFKKTYMRRGNPFDPRNRERLRSLLGEVMIRNTRSLVNLSLPPRYAQTFVVAPGEHEAELYRQLNTYLRWRCAALRPRTRESDRKIPSADGAPVQGVLFDDPEPPHPADEAVVGINNVVGDPTLPPITRMQLNTLLLAAGSHPATLAPMLESLAAQDQRAAPLLERVHRIGRSAKEQKLLEILRQGQPQHKILVFANFRVTLQRLRAVLQEARIPFSVFSGDETAKEKDEAVAALRESVPVMLCSESGGEGRNLQFANTLINYDLPWNPMRIEQRVGRIHRIGQTREVFVFNLCTADSLEERILRILNDKIRMFELVVGEVGSILGNLEEGEEFESLVLDLWLRARDTAELDDAFDHLGQSLIEAQDQYLKAKELDEAMFGEDYE